MHHGFNPLSPSKVLLCHMIWYNMFYYTSMYHWISAEHTIDTPETPVCKQNVVLTAINCHVQSLWAILRRKHDQSFYQERSHRSERQEKRSGGEVGASHPATNNSPCISAPCRALLGPAS